MCIKKIKAFRKKYAYRIRCFYSSSIAGLFSGLLIGILFCLITDATFNRWINPFNLGELFAAVVYFSFVFITLFLLYYIGKLLMWLLVSKKKDELIGFRINYFASTYVSSWSASLVILHNQINSAIIVSILYLLLYFVVEYYAVRNSSRSE